MKEALDFTPTPETLDLGNESVAGTKAKGVLLGLGSQSEEALRRMYEDLGIDMVTMPFDTPAEELADFDVVCPSGGANSVHDEDAPQLDPRIFTEDFEPLVVGVCLGAQTMVHAAGGTVIESGSEGGGSGKYGPQEVTVVSDRADGGFRKLGGEKFKLVHSNGDHMEPDGMPEHFEVTAMTGDYVAAFVDTRTGNVGIQPHPELSDAVGYGIIRNIFEANNLNLQPSPANHFEQMVAEINEAVDEDTDLLLGFSGGVDSNVVADAVVASDVPPERIHILHLDLSTNRTEDGVPESDVIMERFEQQTGIRPHFKRLSPEEVFHTPVELFDDNGTSLGWHRLSEQTNSEMKRKVFSQIYGNAFSGLIEEEGLEPNHTKIVQGTLYPDVIESIGKGKVKTHHNMGPFFVRLEREGKTINPASRYFKGDMRRMGEERGMTPEEYDRQPFPGPGLIPRIVCSDGEPLLPPNPDEVWERAKTIVGDEFGVFLGGFQTVGQKGDKRSLAWPVMLSGEPDWERMNHLMSELGNHLPEFVNRVYHLSGERVDGISSAGTMTPTFINEESIGLLQGLDDNGNKILREHGVLNLDVTDQVPIGLLPTAFHESNGGRTMFWRPFKTPRIASFLNGVAVTPLESPEVASAVHPMLEMAIATRGIERVAFDITHKPYGSTEAE